MYYNASEKEELFLAVNDKFAPIKIGSTKTVIFELSKGAEDFSPVFGKSRPEFSSKNSLELLSASQKNPGLSVLQLENVEWEDQFLEYKDIEEKERLGGLVYAQDQPLAFHVKDNRAVTIAAVVDGMADIISDKGEGHEIFEKIIDAKFVRDPPV